MVWRETRADNRNPKQGNRAGHPKPGWTKFLVSIFDRFSSFSSFTSISRLLIKSRQATDFDESRASLYRPVCALGSDQSMQESGSTLSAGCSTPFSVGQDYFTVTGVCILHLDV